LARIPVYLFVRDEHDPHLARIKDQGLPLPGALTKPVQAEPLTAVLSDITL
jgi:hypothetical protein